MKKYKALTSFSGLISMAQGEIRELPDSPVTDELLRIGYIEPIDIPKEEEKPKRKGTKK